MMNTRLFVLLAAGLLTACPGGATFVAGDCEGPCNPCSTNDDCSAGSSCVFGLCQGGLPTRATIPFDPLGDGVGEGDSGPGDGIGGDSGASGDGSGQSGGDTTGGDGMAGDGGLSCDDPDQDGYCPCCPLGNDCDESDPGVNPGAIEACDARDNDCDGQIDEGVVNSCGTCAAETSCFQTTYGSGGSGSGLPEPTAGNNVVQNPNGSITQSLDVDLALDAWVANDKEGTISRVDTERGVEIGRYYAARISPTPTGYEPDIAYQSGCWAPSRTSVFGGGPPTLRGSVVVGLRAHRAVSGPLAGTCPPGAAYRNQGAVTLIKRFDPVACAGPDLSLCACDDRNNSGSIETSRDCDGHGVIDDGMGGVMCPPQAGAGVVPDGIDLNNPNEFLGFFDECLAKTVALPYQYANARAVAIDGNGAVWVGDFQDEHFFKFDGDLNFLDPDGPGPLTALGGVSVEAGVPVANGGTIPTGGVHPYGAVAGLDRIWFVDSFSTGRVLSIDVNDGVVRDMTTHPTLVNYGITIDAEGDIWTGVAGNGPLTGSSWLNTDPIAARYNVQLGTWSVFQPPLDPPTGLANPCGGGTGVVGDEYVARGLAATADGIVYTVMHDLTGYSWLLGFDRDTGALVDEQDLTKDCGACYVVGAGVGADNNIYAVAQDGDALCRYDPVAAAAGVLDPVESIPVGEGPYTYSDFTGSSWRLTNPDTYTVIVPACGPGTILNELISVSWDASVVGGAELGFELRVGADPVTIGGLPVVGARTQTSADPNAQVIQLNLSGSDIQYLQLKFQFTRDPTVPQNVATLNSLGFDRICLPNQGQ